MNGNCPVSGTIVLELGGAKVIGVMGEVKLGPGGVKSMNDFEAEFKQMMADTQQEVNAEVYESRAKYLHEFEAAINRLLAVRLGRSDGRMASGL